MGLNRRALIAAFAGLALPGLAPGSSAATLTLTIDVSPQLEASLSALAEAAEGSLEVREALLDFLYGGPELRGLDLERLVTCRAGDGRIALEPSDLLQALAAAVRAGQVDFRFLDVHGGPSRG